MAFVTLPGDHQEADLTIAARIASLLELEELHVFEPVRVEPGALALAPPARRGGLLAAIDHAFERLADLVAPWSATQPKIGKLRRRASRSTPAWSAATTSRSLRST